MDNHCMVQFDQKGAVVIPLTEEMLHKAGFIHMSEVTDWLSSNSLSGLIY